MAAHVAMLTLLCSEPLRSSQIEKRRFAAKGACYVLMRACWAAPTASNVQVERPLHQALHRITRLWWNAGFFHESGDGVDGIKILRNDVLVGDLKMKCVFKEGDEFKNARRIHNAGLKQRLIVR